MLKSGMRIQKRLRATVERYGRDCSDDYGWDKPLGEHLLAIESCIGHCQVVLYAHVDRTRQRFLRLAQEHEHILRIVMERDD